MPGTDHRSRRSSDARPLVLLAVVDDETRAEHAYALAASGFAVVAPPDAIAWCGDASHERPDIAFTEILGADDWAFVQRFKRHAHTRDIPLVALAADAGPATCERARREGCAAVCVKTCSPDVLVRGFRALLQQVERAPGPRSEGAGQLRVRRPA